MQMIRILNQNVTRHIFDTFYFFIKKHIFSKKMSKKDNSGQAVLLALFINISWVVKFVTWVSMIKVFENALNYKSFY